MGRWAQYRKRGTAPASGFPLPAPLLTDFLLADAGGGDGTIQLETTLPAGATAYRASVLVNSMPFPDADFTPVTDPNTLVSGDPGDIITSGIAWLVALGGPQLSPFSPTQTIELS